jgi:pilus assembly protein Flp/PilA
VQVDEGVAAPKCCFVQDDRAVDPYGNLAGTKVVGLHTGAMVMKTLTKLFKDEQGGEVLEYALIAGLIVVAAIAVITSVGGKVLARWTSLNGSL